MTAKTHQPETTTGPGIHGGSVPKHAVFGDLPPRLLIGVGFALALIVALAGYSLWQSRENLKHEAEADAEDLVNVLEGYIYSAIHEGDLALHVAAEEYRRAGKAGSSAIESYTALLDILGDGLPYLTLGATDATGLVTYGKGINPVTRVRLADYDYFLRARERTGLVISAPLLTGMSPQSVIPMARRLERSSDGRFDGIVYASIKVEQFNRLFASLRKGGHSSVTLFDADTNIYAHYPEPSGPGGVLGLKVGLAEFNALWQEGRKSATFREWSATDGIWRSYSYLQVGDYPLYVMVGQAEEDYLAPWKVQAGITAAVLVILALLVAVLARSLRHSLHAQDQVYADLAASQDRLRASEARFRALFEHTAIGHFLVEPDSLRVLESNQAAAEIFGYSREELCCLRVPDFEAAMGGGDISGIRQRLMSKGQMQFESKVYRKSGELRHLHITLEILPASGGDQIHATQIDITERKRVEAELLQHRHHLEELVQKRTAELMATRAQAEEHLRIAAVAFQSRDGMIVTDAKGTILQVNEAFTKVTGYSADEAVGKNPSLLRSGRQDAAFYRNLWEAISREGHWEGKIWNRRKDGGIYAEWLSISGICDKTGKITHYLGSFSDINEPREAERKILELAFYDPLTGLPNRRLMLDRLNQALAASARSKEHGAVLILDLDHFKTLNDTRGHDVGDELLTVVAQRLRDTLRERDTAARIGGDEYAVILEGLSANPIVAANYAEIVAGKLHAAISQPAMLRGVAHHITPSIGVALFCAKGEIAEGLVKQGDLALHQAKDAGRNTIRFYNPEMQVAVDRRADTEAGLRRALAHGELALHYQPQVGAGGRLLGAEALLRWQPPGRAMISPAAFIPVAEDSGLILPIGSWVLETACRQLAAWAADPDSRDLLVAVNISARQFRQPDFIDQVVGALQRSGANPARLELELTESLLLDDIEKVIRTMQELKALGVRFSIDDFGTGYSSLAYLKRLPLDQIKIDQSFVRDIAEDTEDRAIVQAIISLGSSLGLQVIAEGVETHAQRQFLADHGCHAYQGYLFGRPGPVADLDALARSMGADRLACASPMA